ncbi:MAG: hypothetical protein MK098_15015 [Marinovum sp.]|nr:hypothetical protein [Marinovum sp.]
MSSAMQWKLVEILLRWEAQAKELERICPPLPGQVPSGFRPKIVGGTDFTKNPETKEALECS